MALELLLVWLALRACSLLLLVLTLCNALPSLPLAPVDKLCLCCFLETSRPAVLTLDPEGLVELLTD